MPYEITLDQKPLGYSRTSAVEGQMVQVVAREFLSSEDGERFFVRMDHWPTKIVQALPSSAGIWPSTVDHLVALVRQDLTATVYVNELRQVAQIRAAGPVEAGAEVRQRDIADVTELRFDGLNVPEDVALVIVFSQGWAQGLVFRLLPVSRRPLSSRLRSMEATRRLRRLSHESGALSPDRR